MAAIAGKNTKRLTLSELNAQTARHEEAIDETKLLTPKVFDSAMHCTRSGVMRQKKTATADVL